MSVDLDTVLALINPPEQLRSLADVRQAIDSPGCYSVVEKRFYVEAVELFRDLAENRIRGDFLACGVWRGGAAVYLHALNHHFGLSRKLWLSDTFSGFVREDIQHKKDQWALRLLDKFTAFEQSNAATFPKPATVEALFRRCGLWDELVNIVEGPLERTLPSLDLGPLALVHIDVDFYEPTKAALEIAYPKLEPGGYVIIDDYGVGGFNCKEAVDEFRAQHGIESPLHFMTSYAACWKKPHA